MYIFSFGSCYYYFISALFARLASAAMMPCLQFTKCSLLLYTIFCFLAVITANHNERLSIGHQDNNDFDDTFYDQPYIKRRPQFLTKGKAGLDVECTMRSIAYDMAMKNPIAKKHSRDILLSLNASACPNWTSTFSFEISELFDDDDDNNNESYERKLMSCCPCHHETILFVDCQNGNDDISNHGTCIHRPLKTVHRAQDIIRQLRLESHSTDLTSQTATVYIRGVVCYFEKTFHMKESNVIWKAFPNEHPVFSGGALLTNLTWSQYTSNILVADIPNHVNVSAIDGLFTFRKGQGHHPTYDNLLSQIRLIRARYPNGNSEIDRMPTNYDKLGGSVSYVDAWKMAGNISIRFPGIIKHNSSFYPWFGHSNDIRWVLDYHIENASSYYGTKQQFWQPKIATSAKYVYNNINSSMESLRQANVLSWGAGDAIIHVIHYSWWGNWQWGVEKIDYADNQTSNSARNNNVTDVFLKFGRGGWQDAHGGAVSHNYFYIENVLEELDASGEWYIDKVNRKLYYWPLPQQRDNINEWAFVATQLQEIVHIHGGRSKKKTSPVLFHPIRNVWVEGITFAHSTTSYLKEQYVVPSAGDWAVLPKGAVTINRAINVSLDSCTWLQVNGNGAAFHGMVHNSMITKGDFLKIGDSGIVSVGRLPTLTPYNGFGVISFPSNITISSCHFGQTGVYGKQTSALFVAVSKGIHFVDNVLYDGPRAGVNINDGFGGGHKIARNVIFNQVLESGDHGPINTWSRSAYIQESKNSIESTASVIPEWNYIDQNFVMIGPKFGSLYGPGDGPCSNGDPTFYCPKNGGSLFSCLDHDDGSEYYLDTRNVCVFAGMKNYIGQNKIWDSNLIIFPEGSASQNRSGMSCIWTSMDMAANDKESLPCSVRPCRTKEVFTNNTCLTYSNEPLEYDMFNESDLLLMGCENTTIPYTARNRYYLNAPYWFHDKWNLSKAQSSGVDIGSKEFSLENLSVEKINSLASTFLNLESRTID